MRLTSDCRRKIAECRSKTGDTNLGLPSSICNLQSAIGNRPRRGVSILEVLAAVTIFMVAFGAISELLNLSARQAQDAYQRQQAVLLCQSKLAEVVAGAIALSGQPESPCEEDPAWVWALECEQNGEITGLWNVTVRVSRAIPDVGRVECVIQQRVLDPSLRGSTMDTTTVTGTESQDMSTTGSSTTSGTSTTPTTGGSR